MKQRTKLEIIEDTYKFYTAFPEKRAIDKNGKCSFKTKDGRKCAVGRFLVDNIQPQDEGSNGFSCSNYGLCKANSTGFLDNLLLPDYRGHSEEFWEELQKFHDNKHYWKENNEGILKLGQGFYERLKELYG